MMALPPRKLSMPLLIAVSNISAELTILVNTDLFGHSYVGDHLVNLREAVLDHRIRYSLTTLDDRDRGEHLLRAGKALEK
jgi:hypothetical protein